jgi:hypothetical protein
LHDERQKSRDESEEEDWIAKPGVQALRERHTFRVSCGGVRFIGSRTIW